MTEKYPVNLIGKRYRNKLDKTQKKDMYVNLLEKFYRHLIKGGRGTGIHLPHSRVFYIRAAMREDKDFIAKLGRVPTLQEVEEALDKEIGSYWSTSEVPEWFAQKYDFIKDKEKP
jgi:hypothetical protein|tara:strand:- start:435 stop:779 length:345 start_codon:yes stop_codon:yes gene_type:complete